jgi:hypothetical protein
MIIQSSLCPSELQDMSYVLAGVSVVLGWKSLPTSDSWKHESINILMQYFKNSKLM